MEMKRITLNAKMNFVKPSIHKLEA